MVGRRATKRARAARPRAGARSGARYGWRGVALIAVTTVIVLLVGVIEAPRVVRQVWSLIGVHQVEAHAESIRRAAAESGVDANLLAAVMYAESRGNVAAVSSADALGLFQLMPSSASDAAKRLKLPEPTREDLLSNGELNTRLAASHLAWLVRNEGPDLERVLVAYNAGRAKLARWIRDAGSYAAWRTENAARSETLAYAQQVLEFRARFIERNVIEPRPIPDPTPTPITPTENTTESTAPAGN